MCIVERACGYGGTGRRARLRILWRVFSVEVRIFLPASSKQLNDFVQLFFIVFRYFSKYSQLLESNLIKYIKLVPLKLLEYLLNVLAYLELLRVIIFDGYLRQYGRLSESRHNIFAVSVGGQDE